MKVNSNPSKALKYGTLIYFLLAIWGNFTKTPTLFDVYHRVGIGREFNVRLVIVLMMIIGVERLCYSLRTNRPMLWLIPLVKLVIAGYASISLIYNILHLKTIAREHPVNYVLGYGFFTMAWALLALVMLRSFYREFKFSKSNRSVSVRV